MASSFSLSFLSLCLVLASQSLCLVRDEVLVFVLRQQKGDAMLEKDLLRSENNVRLFNNPLDTFSKNVQPNSNGHNNESSDSESSFCKILRLHPASVSLRSLCQPGVLQHDNERCWPPLSTLLLWLLLRDTVEVTQALTETGEEAFKTMSLP